MSAIGGYFELELNNFGEYHQSLLKLNTGRNALEAIILSRKYSKVFLPYYSCEVILEPLLRNCINYEFYSINRQLEILDLGKSLQDKEALIYINYFGLKSKYIRAISNKITNLIIDNSQAFFDLPISGIDTFYSARKFFGVSDGAYLSSDSVQSLELDYDCSAHRFSHLLIRHELNPDSGLDEFQKNEASLSNNSIKSMSKLTRKILANVDYKRVEKTRNANFNFLNDKLRGSNKLSFEFDGFKCPLVYPYLTEDTQLRERLLRSKIFVATYWPNVLKLIPDYEIESNLAKNLIPLPIDQRYNIQDMIRIVNVIMNE